MNRIAIYTRKSIYVENSESIETQICLCKEYFKSKGEFTVEIFEDEGFSGKNTNRPAFQRMMNEVKLGKYDTIAVYKIDRIARNIVDFVKIYDELEGYNVKIVSITEGFDPSTPMGRMLMMILASFADMERTNIAQRVKDNLLQLAKKGAFTGGKLPFGCTSEKGKDGKTYVLINEEEKIKFIFDTYLESGNLYATHKKLVELGYNISTKSSLKWILTNPVYCKSSNEISAYLASKKYEILGISNQNGYMTYGCNVNEPIAIVGKHKACISPGKFLKVQMLFDGNKERAKIARKDSKIHWLSNMVKCPVCGGNYILIYTRKTNAYYACTNRVKSRGKANTDKERCSNSKYIDVDKLENDIKNLVLKLGNFEEFKDVYKQKRFSLDNITELEKTISITEKQISNLVDKLSILSNAAGKTIMTKIEELTIKNSEYKNSLEIQKLLAIEVEINKENEKYVYDNILEFALASNAEEMKNKIRLIFKYLIYDPVTKQVEMEFL